MLDLKYLYLLLIFAYVLLFPFSKVEESFNLQATHDLLYHSTIHDLASFDHLEFPGVVPRTFLGAIAVSMISWPLFAINYFLLNGPKYWTLLLVRCSLGFLTWCGACAFVKAVRDKFGARCGQLMWLLHCLQFHLPFYSSRTLPNTFALALAYYAYSYWLQGKGLRCLVVLGYAAVIFRCDVLVLLAPLTLQMLACGEVPLARALLVGAQEACCALLLTVLADSRFWRRWLWPEGVVLFFNTVENKSAEWGVQPWHWYLTSALARSMHLLLPLAALGFTGLIAFPTEARLAASHPKRTGKATSASTDTSLSQLALAFLLPSSQSDPRGDAAARWVRYYCAPVLAFLALYSFLPHKELRFIFPALPMLTLAAAVGLDRLLPPDDSSVATSKKKSANGKKTTGWLYALQALVYAAVGALLAASVAVCAVFALASYHNYPGGVAMQRLTHSHIRDHVCQAAGSSSSGFVGKLNFSVHIDVAPAMTGVSRFLQVSPLQYQCGSTTHTVQVSYSKQEGLTDWRAFDWLLTDDPIGHGKERQFAVAEAVDGFERLRLSRSGLSVQLAPKIYILKNINLSS